MAAGYLALNAAWSPDRVAAAMIVGMILLFVTAVDMSLIALQKSERQVLEAMATGFVIGFIVASLYLCFEVLSGQWIRRTLSALQPWLQPKALHTRVGPAGAILFEPHLLNHNITAATMMLWPALLALNSLKITRSLRSLLLLGLLPLVVAILLSEHATSKLALLGSAGIFLLYRASPALSRGMTMTGWVVASLLVVPIAFVLFAQQMYTTPWLFPSAQKRIVIWGYTSKQVARTPILGVGIAATRVFHKTEGGAGAPVAPGSQFMLETGWHSHNIFLQTWFETGAIGALFLLTVGVLILRSFAAAPAASQPFLWSTFAACALIGGSSFSLWAPWFMASFGLVASFVGLAVALLAKSEPQP
jgi:O-antigen ligase